MRRVPLPFPGANELLPPLRLLFRSFRRSHPGEPSVLTRSTKSCTFPPFSGNFTDFGQKTFNDFLRHFQHVALRQSQTGFLAPAEIESA
jgi:hypothetical protein